MSETGHRRPLEQRGRHQPGPLEVTDNSQRRGDEAPLVNKEPRPPPPPPPPAARTGRHPSTSEQPSATSSSGLPPRSCRRPGVPTRRSLLGRGRLGRTRTPRTVTGWECAAVPRPAGRALAGHLRSSPATRSSTPMWSCQGRSGPPGVPAVRVGLPAMAVGHAGRHARPTSRANGTIGWGAGRARPVRFVFGHRRFSKRWCCRATPGR